MVVKRDVGESDRQLDHETDQERGVGQGKVTDKVQASKHLYESKRK